jgi:hypothetical protein
MSPNLFFWGVLAGMAAPNFIAGVEKKNDDSGLSTIRRRSDSTHTAP